MMKKNYVEMTLGSSPTDETCVQLGTPNYEIRAHLELTAYRDQLYRLMAKSAKVRPSEFRLKIRENPHDYGIYLDLVAAFDADDEASSNLFEWLDHHTPDLWDDEARAFLGLAAP